VKDYAGEHGVSLIGDIPIYVNCDSVDVWTHRELFNLDATGCPLTVAGVPPDYFSETGQRWGNPHYRWEMLRETQYDWWVKRIGHTMRLVDFIRIDHFRGFVGYWEVPASEDTALNGRWVEAPAIDFFTHLSGKFPYLPVIAEDLGIITDDVRDVMARFGLPGMRVLQFAFNDGSPDQPFLPHNYVPNCIAYTGTHDNNTTRGWFEGEASMEARSRFFRYLGHELIAEHAPIEFIRLIMMSVADTVILPMQDVLALGASARMNTPSTIAGNWEWRLDPALVTPDVSGMLSEMTEIYGR
jgi:4-alpha-glucanotransferase